MLKFHSHLPLTCTIRHRMPTADVKETSYAATIEVARKNRENA